MSNEPLRVGQRVNVHLFPNDDTLYLEVGTIDRVDDAGPYDGQPERRIKVRFEDPTKGGGTGYTWVRDDQLTVAS